MFPRLSVSLIVCLMLFGCGTTRWTHPNLSQSKFDMDVNNCRYQSQMATQQQPRQETYQQSMQRNIALAQMDPATRGAAMTHEGAQGLGNAIGSIFNAAAIFDQCMYQAGYRKQ
ncbi:MAG: hypothetical protein WAO82_06310 [Limnohabitans sp.]